MNYLHIKVNIVIIENNIKKMLIKIALLKIINKINQFLERKKLFKIKVKN